MQKGKCHRTHTHVAANQAPQYIAVVQYIMESVKQSVESSRHGVAQHNVKRYDSAFTYAHTPTTRPMKGLDFSEEYGVR